MRMYSDEEKKAIEQLRSWREYIIKHKNSVTKANDIEFYLRTALNLIEKQQKHLAFYEKDESYKARILELKAELEKKDKVINEMAESLEDELTIDIFCTKENCYADEYINGDCQKCLNCIKEYFEERVEGEK